MTTLQEKSVFAALPRTERARSLRVDVDPKGKSLVYCHGNSVYIRNIMNPTEVDIYTQHAKPTTVARVSPSGFYIASCDEVGKIRIWDTVNKEHILKAEYPALGGFIRDVSWSGDSQKIAVCGQGREKFGYVFNMDTGTSVGDLSFGHSKPVNSISIRQTRPFRIVTAGEDMNVAFYEGPPFKFKRSQQVYTRFVNTARFSPDGEVILTGDSDGKIFRFDGKTCEDLVKLDNAAHKGGVYEICFSKDGKRALSVAGDKKAHLFSVETGDIECVFDMGQKKDSSWQDMLVGCVWTGEEMIVINCFGHLIYLDPSNPSQPKRVVKGHVKPITSVTLSEDKKTAFTCSQEGIIHWDVQSGDSDFVEGKGHNSEVSDVVVDGNCLFSVGNDDALRVTSVTDRKFTGAEVKLDSQPKQVASHKGTLVVVCVNHVIVVDGAGQVCGDSGLKKSTVLKVDKEALSVSIHPNGSEVAVGFKDKEIRIYSLQGGTLTETRKIQLALGDVCSVAYSPSGAFLAYSCGKNVGVRSTPNYDPVERESEKHTARVCSLAWSPNSENFASGALDGQLVVWKPSMEYRSLPSIKAYSMSHINKLAWVDTNTIFTVGHDSNIKQYSLV